MSLATFLQFVGQATLTADTAPFGPDPLPVLFPFTQISFADGDGVDEANTVGILTITLTASGDVTVNLSTDLNHPRTGEPVTFTRIVFLGAHNPADPVEEPWANVIVGDAGSLPWEEWTTEPGATYDIHAGVPWLVMSRIGYTLNPSIGYNLKFSNPNTNGTQTIHLMVVGS